ncbi:unnamed protein product [Ascophyllum nodosum]
MGDRRPAKRDQLRYFKQIEVFMTTVSEVVLEQGMQPPLFHIFTETALPCPDPKTGLFPEFPMWPVELDQAKACSTVETPAHCQDE